MWKVKQLYVLCCVLYVLTDPISLRTADSRTHRVNIIFSVHMLGIILSFHV